MRVLVVVSSLLPGGAERVSLDLARHLVSSGHEVRLFIARLSNQTPAIYDIPEGMNSYHVKRGAENGVLRPIGNVILLKSILRKWRPESLISLGAQYKAISMSGAFDSCKVVLSERNYPPKRYSAKEIELLRRYYKRADKVVFQTREAAECFDDLPSEKIRIIPNAIRFQSGSWKGLSSKRVSFVGRLVEQKNPGMLLRAFDLFHKRHQDYSLHLYGDGPLRKDVERLASDLGIEGEVEFYGCTADVLERVAESRMYVSSSDYEGISNSMLEALSMGVPSVCTDCAGGGAKMAIDDGINGLLVPCGDVEAMAKAMSRVADCDSFAENLSRNAVLSAKRFEPEKIYSQWEDALR